MFAQMFAPICLRRIIFGVQIFAPIFAQIFGAQISYRFLHRSSADFSSTFWRFKNRCSRVMQKCAENLQKNLRRPNGPAREGSPFHLRFPEIAPGPSYSRRAYERPSWRGIFGPKVMLAFAPRFSRINLRMIHSAKHWPLHVPRLVTKQFVKKPLGNLLFPQYCPLADGHLIYPQRTQAQSPPVSKSEMQLQQPAPPKDINWILQLMLIRTKQPPNPGHHIYGNHMVRLRMGQVAKGRLRSSLALQIQ